MPEQNITFTMRHRDIQQFAREIMGIDLTPIQLQIIDVIAAGKTNFIIRRRQGYSLAQKVLQAYVLHEGEYVKHFQRTHYRAITIDGKKFLYCPIGNICSWSEGDFKNKWCHFCKKTFSEIKGGKK